MSEEMEFKLINPTDDGFIKTIEWNSEEIKEKVSQMVAEYKGLVYTEDNIKVAREERAYLNKLKTAIDSRRKEVKKLCEAPYKEFEAEVKDVLKLIDEPCSLIDCQIKAFEEKKREEKREQILAVYNDHIGEYADMLAFDKFFDRKWLNESVSLKKASTELADKVDKAIKDIETLKTEYDDKYATAVISKYAETLDFSEATREFYRLRDLDRKIEEQKRKEEEEKKSYTEQMAERLGMTAENDASEEPTDATEDAEETQTDECPPEHEEAVNEDVAEPQSNDAQEEPRGVCKFWVRCTKAQLTDLAVYMKAHGIEYGNIK